MLLQVGLLETLVGMVEESQCQERPLAQNNRLSLCTWTVPILLGLCRALGRFNGCEDPLISHIFPPKKRRRRAARNPKTSDVQNKVGSEFFIFSVALM